jgi:dTDP-4-dehydrorhamnose reductase
MKKILVLGSKGMAGHVVSKLLPIIGDYQVTALARNIEKTESTIDLDVTKIDELKQLISNGNFDAIINCIGILNKDAEDHPDKAIWFNSYFPHFLEAHTKNTTTKIVHISTDCVFSGKKGGYTENDIKDGSGCYAQSKAFGELNNNKDITLRTSIIGPELNANGIGLFHWFMKQEANSKIKGFSKAYWSGITTIELTKVIHEAIQQNITGLIQITQENKIDKYSLLKLFNRIFRTDSRIIVENSDYEVDKSMVSIRHDFHYKVPQYEVMMNDMKKWIEENNYSY